LLPRSKKHDRVAARVVLVALLLSESVALSQSSSAATSATIVVTFDAHSVEQGPAISAVKAHLSGLPVRIVIEPVEPARTLEDRLATSGSLALSRGALGTFSIEVGAHRELLIFFTEPDGSATLIRRLPAGQEGVRVALDQAAIVVRSLVEALLEGRRVGMAEEGDAPAVQAVERDSPRTKEQPPDASPNANGNDSLSSEPLGLSDEEPEEPEIAGPIPARRTVAISGGYTGTDFASDTAWESGFALGLRWLALPVVYAAARYTFFPGMEAGDDTAQIWVTRHPIEFIAGYVGPARLSPNAELGLNVDYTGRDTLRTGAQYVPRPSDARWMIALGARAGLTWSATSTVQASLRGGADLLLTRYSYVIPAGRAPISPHNIRPRLEFDVTLGLW
jgi:hypothetical protein